MLLCTTTIVNNSYTLLTVFISRGPILKHHFVTTLKQEYYVP